MNPITIIRHRKERKSKCSLRGLEDKEGIQFYTHPGELPKFDRGFVLSMSGPVIDPELVQDEPLILIDGTWALAEKIEKREELQGLQRFCLPTGWKTAYPRKQTGCSDPSEGLASVEALYIAQLLLGRKVEGLLDHYYWKDKFLELNCASIEQACIIHRQLNKES